MQENEPTEPKRERFEGPPSTIFSFTIGDALDSQALTLLGVILGVALTIGFGVGGAVGAGWWSVLVGTRRRSCER